MHKVAYKLLYKSKLGFRGETKMVLYVSWAVIEMTEWIDWLDGLEVEPLPALYAMFSDSREEEVSCFTNLNGQKIYKL